MCRKCLSPGRMTAERLQVPVAEQMAADGLYMSVIWRDAGSQMRPQASRMHAAVRSAISATADRRTVCRSR